MALSLFRRLLDLLRGIPFDVVGRQAHLLALVPQLAALGEGLARRYPLAAIAVLDAQLAAAVEREIIVFNLIFNKKKVIKIKV